MGSREGVVGMSCPVRTGQDCRAQGGAVSRGEESQQGWPGAAHTVLQTLSPDFPSTPRRAPAETDVGRGGGIHTTSISAQRRGPHLRLHLGCWLLNGVQHPRVTWTAAVFPVT